MVKVFPAIVLTGKSEIARQFSFRSAVIVLLATVLGTSSYADDLIVQKQTFVLPSYTTVAGGTIKSVQIGWEAAGTLNADKSNAILVTHFFSATSHAFGKYNTEDKVAGYWDAIIGPGKAIDTNKYYVLSSDALVNLNAGTVPAEERKDPAKAIGNRFKIEGFLDQAATARAGFADANHFLYLCKANQLATVDPAKIKAPMLLLYAPNDLVFYEPILRETMQIAEAGGSVDGVPLSGPNGHLNGVFAVGQASEKITAFLAR